MIGRAARRLERLTPLPALLRGGLFLAATAALVLATPAGLRTSPVVLTGLLALAATVALAPRGPLPTVLILAAAGGWVLTTEGYGQPVTPLRVLLLAGLLYLVHSLATLAAVVPTDAVVAADVVRRWLGRALAVVAGATGLSAAALAALAGLPAGRSVAATLAGLVLAAALPIAVARLFR